MNCPNCKNILSKPTEKQKSLSLLLSYGQATHYCKKCKILFIIKELIIPAEAHEIVKMSLMDQAIWKTNKNIDDFLVLGSKFS